MLLELVDPEHETSFVIVKSYVRERVNERPADSINLERLMIRS